MDDNRIVDLFLSRDQEAISRTSDKYGSRLRSIAYGITEELHTAEECENDGSCAASAMGAAFFSFGDS